MPLVCPQCFTNSGLRRRIEEIRPDYDEGRCDHHPKRKGTPLDAVGRIVDEVFRNNYEVSGEDLLAFDGEEVVLRVHQKGLGLRGTLEALTGPTVEGIGDALADELVANDAYWPPDGEEAFYDDDFLYERIAYGDGGHSIAWRQFCDSIMHEQRFFNREADGLLGDLFKYIHLQRDAGRKPPVYLLDAAAGRIIHRARIVNDDEMRKIHAEPQLQMGPPPKRKGKPNRMNPSGIVAFYGSFERATCISELRPLVGCQVVAGEFHLRRPICVLDTTRFRAPPKELNLFARDHVRRLGQWRFMQKFMREIAKPISKDDEHLDYVPTQAVAEYLSQVHAVRVGQAQHKIEAIIYQSAQRPSAVNIVMFGEAGMVETANMTSPKPVRAIASFMTTPFPPPEPRDPGLALNVASLAVLRVTEATFPTDDPVRLDFAVNPPF